PWCSRGGFRSPSCRTPSWSRRGGMRNDKKPGFEINCDIRETGDGRRDTCRRWTRLSLPASSPPKFSSAGTTSSLPCPVSRLPVYENRHHVLSDLRRLGCRRDRAGARARPAGARGALHVLREPVSAARL